MTTLDNLKLEVAFADGPDVVSPTWTDITSYWVQARDTTITRGRPDEGEVPPGTLSLTLDNTDGRFAAGYTSGAYYPNVKLRKQIRITYREQTESPTNLFVNPSVKTNITNWSGGYGTGGAGTRAQAADSTAPSGSGQVVLQTWTTAPSNASGLFIFAGATGSNALPVTAGLVYSARMSLKTSVSGQSWRLFYQWYDSGGVQLSNNGGTAVALTANTWTEVTVEGVTAPASAVRAILLVSMTGTLPSIGSTLAASAAIPVQRTSSLAYFDGDTTDGTNGWDYNWSGATYNSSSVTTPTVYPRFRGHVDEWPTQWPTGDNTYAEAQITATDRTKRIQSLVPFRGVPQEAIMLDDPVGYWPLTEPTGATTAANIVPGAALGDMTQQQLGTGGTIAFGEGTGVATDSSPAAVLTPASGGNGKYLKASGVFSGTKFAAGICINTTDTDGVIFQLGVNPLDANAFLAVYLTGGVLTVTFRVGPVSPGTVSASTTVNDGHTHDVAVHIGFGTFGGTHFLNIYVDGALDSSWVITSSTPPAQFDRVLVGGGEDTLCAGGDALAATLSHMRVYADTVTAGSQLQVQADGTLNGHRGDSSDERIARYASWVGMSSFTSLDAGRSTSLTHIDVKDRAPWDAMKDVTTTEGGQLFASKDGLITLHSRSRRYNAAAALTLDAAKLDIGEGLLFRINDRFLLNDITVNTPDGYTARRTDSTSISDNGYARTTQDVFTTVTNEAQSFADWELAQGATPTPRAEQLEVDILTNTQAIRLAMLTADISTRISLANLPAGAGAPAATADLFIEGYTETISTGGWSLVLSTSPAVGYDVWQLAVAGKSELGVTTRLAH